MSLDYKYVPVNAVSAALHNRCPRCGQGKLFKGFIGLPPRCSSCKLDYTFSDSGDGPAVFMSLIGGAIVLGLLMWTEIEYELPIWLEMAIFLPLALIVCLGSLRPMKALLIGLQYRNKAEQGRLVP